MSAFFTVFFYMMASLRVYVWMLFHGCFLKSKDSARSKKSNAGGQWTVVVVVIACKSLSRFCEIRRYDDGADGTLHFDCNIDFSQLSAAAACLSGDQVLILLKVTTTTISTVSQHGHTGSNDSNILF